MTISSRTPEGHPNRCPVCRRRLRLLPSWPSADAACPHCGSLVWFPAANARSAPAGHALPADFTLDDFRKQFEQLKEMGPLKDLLGAMPGLGDVTLEGEDLGEGMRRIQGMIDAMTKAERENPDIMDTSRRCRIAAGSGTEPHDIKEFLSQFDQVRTLMRQMAKMNIWERI
jgi:signal recognition particle GTPase